MGENRARSDGEDWDVNGFGEHASCPVLNDTNSQVDGDASRDIAICGFSVKFPEDATSSEAFWKMMLEKRCASSDFPAEYLNPDGFHEGERKNPKLNSVSIILRKSYDGD